MRKSFLGFVVLAIGALVPYTLFAACEAGNDLCRLVDSAGSIINTLIGIVSAIALLVFFWGIVRYIAAAGDEKAKDQGKRTMIGGVIALFVLFSIFGIIRFLQESFNISENDTKGLPPPTIKIP